MQGGLYGRSSNGRPEILVIMPRGVTFVHGSCSLNFEQRQRSLVRCRRRCECVGQLGLKVYESMWSAIAPPRRFLSLKVYFLSSPLVDPGLHVHTCGILLEKCVPSESFTTFIKSHVFDIQFLVPLNRKVSGVGHYSAFILWVVVGIESL